MKVAQITTTLRGGAGIAAGRLSEALVEVGVDSTIISQEQRIKGAKLASKTMTVLQRKLVQASPQLITTFSLSTAGMDQLNSYQILHFHPIYNLFNSKSLLKLAESKKVVMTLHDQRMLTGGCHYSGKCDNYKSGCKDCPQVHKLFQTSVISEKRQIDRLLNHENVSIISPSQWLAQMAEDVIGNSKSIKVIRNPIPNGPIIDSLKARALLKIPTDKFVIGFVSMNLHNELKGLDDLFASLKKIDGKNLSEIHLLLVGRGNIKEDSCGVTMTKVDSLAIQNQAYFYTAMDLLVVPSREDNSPNVIGEALMSGTPVIGSEVGGIQELLNDFSLPHFNTKDHDHFASQLMAQISNPSNRRLLANKAEKEFGYKAIGTKMREFYASLL